MWLLVRSLAALLAAGLAATASLAAEYDCPRVTLIVPYPAGGAADVAGRLIAERLEVLTKKSVVVENRPGATGNIGTAAVVNAKTGRLHAVDQRRCDRDVSVELQQARL